MVKLADFKLLNEKLSALGFIPHWLSTNCILISLLISSYHLSQRGKSAACTLPFLIPINKWLSVPVKRYKNKCCGFISHLNSLPGHTSDFAEHATPEVPDLSHFCSWEFFLPAFNPSPNSWVSLENIGIPGPRLYVNCSSGLKIVLFLFPLNLISFLIQIYNVAHTRSWQPLRTWKLFTEKFGNFSFSFLECYYSPFPQLTLIIYCIPLLILHSYTYIPTYTLICVLVV